MLFDKISKAHRAHILSCSGPKVGIWFISRLIFPTFQLSSPVFSIAHHTWLGLPHPLIVHIFRCICTHPINPMGTHFLLCVHSNEHAGTHDAIHNTIVTITWNVGFHMGREQLHALPTTTFNSFHQWVDIMPTKDDIRTLVNIVIVNPTWTNLLP
jgi:hypothetical protein